MSELFADVAAAAVDQQRTSNKKLCPPSKDSLEDQFKRFATLRRKEPEKCKKIFDDGEALVTCASRGQLSKLRAMLGVLEQEDILIYHTHRMFMESLLQSHFMVSEYILENGYPFRSLSVPSALHECLSSSVVEDSRAEQIACFLCEKHNFDVNFQEAKNWTTALHIAVNRQFVQTVIYLLSRGADVNAIARHDVMPLNLAESADESSPNKSTILHLLLERGARATWRRPEVPTKSPVVLCSFSGGSSSSTSCSFKSSTEDSGVRLAFSDAISAAPSVAPSAIFTTSNLSTKYTFSDVLDAFELESTEKTVIERSAALRDDLEDLEVNGQMFSTSDD